MAAFNLAPLDIKTVKTEGHTATYEIEVETWHSLWLANALRRVLLSSLPGSAITSFRIEGVSHEFQDIPNIKEDVTDIAQNIKQVRLRCFADYPGPLRIEAIGACEVVAGDIWTPSSVEIVNPELHLATLDNEQAHLLMELLVGTGRGFVEAHAHAEAKEEQPIGVILVDAIYSPIVKVKYTIEQAFEQDRDTITLEITTDGTISPDDALHESATLLVRQFRVFANYYPSAIPEDAQGRTRSNILIPTMIYDCAIEDLGLSLRAYNCLRRYGIKKAGQLLEMDETDLLYIRNFGAKSLQELAECLQAKGFLPLGE